MRPPSQARLLERIQTLVRAGEYRIATHSVPHQMKEGFSAQDMLSAVLAGEIIEDYPDRKRCLVYGAVALTEKVTISLHVVCDYSDAQWLDLVTAYIPDETEWENPPVRRRSAR